MKGMELYWAYGSNLNVGAMKWRCPGAIKFAPLFVPDGAMIFRGVADVVFRPGGEIPGGLWWINKRNEATLDAYEGVRSDFYVKRYMKLRLKNAKTGKMETRRCLFYQMHERIEGIFPPSDGYVNCIAQGYRDFGLPLEALNQALQASWKDKEPTQLLVQRHRRRGGKLARFLELDFLGLEQSARLGKCPS